MKNTLFTSALKLWIPILAFLTIAFVVYKVTAQTTVAEPIDFDNGPLVTQKTPANVVLALSVEWPTSGGAYKDASYIDGNEYIGYFNSNRCYSYPGYGTTQRSSVAFNASSDYFTPTGPTNSSYHCNTSGTGTGFSGNYLNYATMSAPDMLRMALTGGDRGIDEQTRTVLDRGTLWNGGSANFRRAASATVTAYVSPFSLNATLYAYNCNDEVIFTSSNSKGCVAPNAADATDLRPGVGPSTASGTTTVTPTIPPFNQVGTAWIATGAYLSTAPTAGPVQSVTLYTNTMALTTTVPPTGAEFPAIIRSYIWTASGQKSVDYQGGGAPNTTTVVTRNYYVCHRTTAPRIITVRPQATSPSCPLGTTRRQYTNSSASNRIIYDNYTQGAANYYAYTSYTAYQVYELRNVWSAYTATDKSIIKPRVLVCDSTEGPTRTVVYGTGTTDFYNYCTKYTSNGTVGYKPEGQIQQKSDSIRLAVFSYLIEEQRNGGVLRAPMKYTGPNKYDTNGSLVTNDQNEWSAATGIFNTNPLSDTTYTYSGVISYLNRFGKTGNYKGLDPVGELWYESLRYLQGLQPSDDATTSIIESTKDGYPVYTTWTDPLTSGCQRNNYILGIGDTNTHYDRTVPGVTRAEQNTLLNEGVPQYDKTYSTTPTVNGSASALNAHKWTQIIDGYERSGAAAVNYTDSLGRSQTTGGNPSANASITNLDTTNTGSSGHSSYHWAGLSYWANTQPIRTDTIGTGTFAVSADKVRVKTFMIDVDENNQNGINAAIKNTSFYLAGKYGYFNDLANDGDPFNGADNSRWADPDGSPKGYVLASQPKKLIAGIKKFFDESGAGGGSFSTIAVSSNAFSASSPDGKTFAPTYIPGQWSGTIKSLPLTLNTTTNSLSAGTTVTWDAGAILTAASKELGTVTLPQVKPIDRKIVTYIDGSTPRAVSFTYADTSNAADLPASFSQVPYSSPITTDSLASLRIDYIRGDRTKELDYTFRPRQSIMGDIINSGPVYKGAPNEKTTGAGYAAFYSANKSRTATVYAGANDGMLHAFRADSGQELFAYIPGAVLGKLPNLTSKNYRHTAFVDAVPVVEEANLSSGWKTVLASGMGGGAQGVFALDVTDPTAFDTSKVMFEFTDKDDPYMGNVTGQPSIVKMRDADSSTPAYKYFLVVSSGYNNYKNDGTATSVATPDQALFFLDLNKAIGSQWVEGTNYFKVILPAADSLKTNGLAQPGIRYGSAGEAFEFFAGDLQGNIWKVAFNPGTTDGINAAAVLDDSNNFPIFKGGGFRKPLFTAKDASNNIQPITSSPVIYPTLLGGNMVIFGTGRLLESADRSSTVTQTIYAVWDSGQTNAGSYSLARNKLEALTMNSVTLSITGNTPTFADNTSSKRGWYFDLTRTNERIVIDPVAATGIVNINSTIPPSSICSDNGDGLKYFLSPSTGKDVLATEPEGGGYLGKSTVVDIDLSTAIDSSYSNRNVSGRRTATKREAILTQRQNKDGTITTTKNIDVTYLATGRIYWREVRDFNRTNP